MVILLLIMVFHLFFSNLTVFCQTGSYSIFENYIDARTSGMGNSFTAIYNGIYNLYSNPALLYQLEKHNITGTYTMEFLDTKNSFIGYGKSVSTKTGVAFGWFRSGTSIEVTDKSEQVLGEKQFIADCIFAGIGFNTKIPGPVGLTIKYLNKNFSPFYLSGLGFDFGIIPITSESFTIGLTLKNIGGTKLSGKSYWSSDDIEETLPTKIRVGTTFSHSTNLEVSEKEMIKIDMKFIVDFETLTEKLSKIAFYPGAEFFLNNTIGFRTGWVYNRGFTMGLSFWHKFIQIDYALLSNENLGNSHRVSTSIRF